MLVGLHGVPLRKRTSHSVLQMQLKRLDSGLLRKRYDREHSLPPHFLHLTRFPRPLRFPIRCLGDRIGLRHLSTLALLPEPLQAKQMSPFCISQHFCRLTLENMVWLTRPNASILSPSHRCEGRRRIRRVIEDE